MRPAVLLALLLPAPAAAHPHVFVDSRVELVMDGSLITAVRLSWTYDEFFSLLLTEEQGLDPDGDAVLTEAELAALAGTVTAWPPDFTGDLVLTHGEEPVPLAPPVDHRVEFREGRVVEIHTRPLATPIDAAAALLVLENYDPYHYVAYEVLPEAALAGAAPGCAATLVPADMAAGQAEVDALYQDLDIAGAGREVQLPPIGYAFTDRLEVRCDG